MNELPGKQELLSYQARWMRRAGAAGVLGAFLVTGAVVLQQAGLNPPGSSSDADQLVFVHAHSGRLILAAVTQGIGFALLLFPLLFLFRSAAGRAERMRRAFVGLVILGPLAFGLGIGISSVGGSKAADKFVKQAPGVESQARAAAQAAARAPSQGKKPAVKPSKGAAATTTTSPTTTAATTTTAAKPQTPEQAASDARENLADHLNRHTTLLVVGGLLSTVGALSLVVALIYTSLWSMRVGLLTRFWGSLGIATGVALVLLGVLGLALIVLWFAAIGLMFLGFWPRSLPPAWEAGEAIPWQRPGEDLGPPSAPPPAGGTVEGSGREISEPPLPEDGAGEEPPQPPYGETQGQRRKKRKRRD